MDNQIINPSNGHDPWSHMGGSNRGRSNKMGGDDFFEEWLQRAQRQWRGRFPKRFDPKSTIFMVIAGLIGIWLLSGFFRVEQPEVGIKLLFGKQWGDLAPPGLNYNFPGPIGTVIKPNVEISRKTEIGYLEVGLEGASNRRNIPEESQMLTGDQNIVDIEFALFWKIKDPIQYVFNIRDPQLIVKVAGESVMREVIGQTAFYSIVTEEKTLVSQKVRVVLQDFLDELGVGVLIDKVDFQKTEPPTEVIDAFNDVQRARQDLDRLRNEAEAYRNKVIPEARGSAAALISEATGYRERLINEAQGEARRFSLVYDSYRVAPEITRKRMYLETISRVLQNSNKVIIDQDSTSSGVLPYLPLRSLENN